MDIKLNSINKVYIDADQELQVLENLSFEVKSGSKTAILGRSGSGKSTLLHIIGGLDKPTSGEVYFDHQDIAGFGSDKLAVFRRKSIGFVFQFHHLLPEFTALENVSMPLIIDGHGEADAEKMAMRLLDEMSLADRATHRPSELSGGERQRVSIARAVINNPAVILADEPTGNLDEDTAEEVTEVLNQICMKLSSTLIIVTHSADLAGHMQEQYEMISGGNINKIKDDSKVEKSCG